MGGLAEKHQNYCEKFLGCTVCLYLLYIGFTTPYVEMDESYIKKTCDMKRNKKLSIFIYIVRGIILQHEKIGTVTGKNN
jgi:hypothetical protein